ncbi:formyl transferase [Flagellimonas olearia]|uniref:phosphoribosylglycinamide formyltransferase 1 n=1 Tax=Flagellimonas olearia TaxID=552546 RepID=A0A444VKY4_9FLAO|nr:formyl transferase [Allomuricauda olearia]RYC51436.1 hypothetical protein DN53_14665 [Allomuricauda olearia]
MKIVLLSGQGLQCDIVYGYLNRRFNITAVVIDDTYKKKQSRIGKVKKRISKYGYIKVFLQLCFTKVCVPILKYESRNRRKKLLKKVTLRKPKHHGNLYRAKDINSEHTLSFVNKNNPDLIIVHGTSIINENFLKNISCPIINFHIGITQKYRGIHGGYWSLHHGDTSNFGTTIHFVDTGIDTGKIIVQKRIKKSKKDNFCTYPILQTIKALGCFDIAIKKIFSKKHKKYQVVASSASRYYSQPTITQYLYKRLLFDVR